MRLFAGDRIYRILDRLGSTDEEGNEEPIEAGMLTKQIEKAQRKVEEQNFLIRKRVLEYDDVMNEQRRIVYEYRDQVLEGRDMGEQSRQEIAGVVERLVDEYAAADYVEDWDLDGLFVALEDIYPVSLDPSDVDRLEPRPRRAGRAPRRATPSSSTTAREEELGEELMRALERYLLLQIIDQRWREHLYDMDYLREGIHLRGFAQIDPLVAYKNEAFTLFSDLMNTIWSDFARMIFHVEVEVEGENGDAPAQQYTPSGSSTRSGRVSYSGGVRHRAAQRAGRGGGAARPPTPTRASPSPPRSQQRRVAEVEQIGRNDPCWCGSGKKFKKCHGALAAARRADCSDTRSPRRRRPGVGSRLTSQTTTKGGMSRMSTHAPLALEQNVAETVAALARTLYPHVALPDRSTRACAAKIDEAAREDAAQAQMIDEGVADLDGRGAQPFAAAHGRAAARRREGDRGLGLLRARALDRGGRDLLRSADVEAARLRGPLVRAGRLHRPRLQRPRLAPRPRAGGVSDAALR